MNRTEVAGVIVIIGLSVGASLNLGAKYGVFGYIAGALLGIIIYFTVGYILLLIGFSVQRIKRRLPRCINGSCSTGDYKLDEKTRNRLWACKCGEHFKLSGRNFFHIDKEKQVIPYKKRAFLVFWRNP